MKWLGRSVLLIGRWFLRDRIAETSYKVESLSRIRSQHQEISPMLLTALVAGEDHRFFEHGGTDAIAVAGAVWRFIRYGRCGGASTIEQQLVRVLTNRRERTLRRKLMEIIVACHLAHRYSKDCLALIYLEVAYFGWEMNGVREACGRLGISIREVAPHQAASVVARLKYPEPQYPTDARRKQISIRARHILFMMERSHIQDRKESANAAVLDFTEM